MRLAWVPVLLAAAWIGCSDAPPPPLSAVVRPEHPRPDFRRDSFVNLNVQWDFAYDPGDVGVDQQWFGRDDVWTDRIQLPFAWEAPAGGLVPPHDGPYAVSETLQADTYRGVAWYRLRLPDPLPADPGLDWHLVFGAVDFEASVWINGKHAVDHTGGYDPFSVDVSSYASPGERVTIVVRAEDETELDGRAQPVGKQGGLWYTRTSGIWQTVYLEERPKVHLTNVRIVPDPDNARVWVHPEVTATDGTTVDVEVRLGDVVVGTAEAPAASDAIAVDIPQSELALWDVDSPTLYDLDVRTTGPDGVVDVVHGYFGMVKVTTDWVPGHGPQDGVPLTDQYKALYVNGRPRYLRCVLDQSYYPDGVYTAPSEDRIRSDLQLAKSFGFNCVRLHVKAGEPIKLRLFDEMGFYVVNDVPSLDLQAPNDSPAFPGRAYFEQGLRAMIARDANHPSIVAWTVFNENWGLIQNGSLLDPTPLADSPDLQQWARQMVGVARSLDPTRPVEDNSAGGIVNRFEHFDTDLDSFHYYGTSPADYRAFLAAQAAGTFPTSPANFVGGALQDGDPWWNSEFAAYSALLPTTDPSQVFCPLFGLVDAMRRQPKLVGWTLTQLTDVEYEQNGLVSYDRSPKPDLCTRDGVSLADVFGDDFVFFDWVDGAEVTAGATVPVLLHFSMWSHDAPAVEHLALRWGSTPAGTGDVTTVPYGVADATITVTAPATPGQYPLVVEATDDANHRSCANRLLVTVK